MADVGTGSTITFGTSGFTGEILSIGGKDFSRPAIDSTHLGTTVYRTFFPGDLSDPGGIELEIQFDPDEDAPINAVAETITVTFPLPAGGITPATMAATGFITDWDFAVPLEDKMMQNITIKLSDTITWVDAT